VAAATGLREGGDRTPAPVSQQPVACTPEKPCESEDLIKRYGTQSFVLALDWHDATGKTRSTVRVDAIAPDLIPDRMMTEAANRLLAMYTTRP
ncbi:MAG: hypothetical protein NZ518_02185, partial [Dehalococcoidia bacterium]|nr:hypothetical protein [Dehalococcoidia bacterium]